MCHLMILEDNTNPFLTRIKRAGTICVLALFIVTSIQGCANNQTSHDVDWVEVTGSAMGTSYQIKLSGIERERTVTIIDSVLALVDKSLSTYDSTSLISRFNDMDSGFLYHWHPDDIYYNVFVEVWDLSRQYYYITSGAFDPSASPLFQVWGFAEKERGDIPSKIEIDSLLTIVGFDSINYPSYSKAVRGGSLNFNAIAKGYGVDQLASALRHNGAENVMVEIGGEVVAIGLSPGGESWKIGINKPVEGASPKDFVDIVTLTNEAMATSGNYRNHFTYKGQTYSHTIDPRTGYPVVSDLKSATVIAETCAVADALATACMVLGEEKAIKLIESLPSVRAVLIVQRQDLLEKIRVGF